MHENFGTEDCVSFFLSLKCSKANGREKLSEPSEDQVKKALIKKAVGYEAKEEIKEFIIDENGKEILAKKRITKKHVSPDLAAMKLLLERYGLEFEKSLENMSDAELFEEKNRLLQLLEEERKNANRKMQTSDKV